MHLQYCRSSQQGEDTSTNPEMNRPRFPPGMRPVREPWPGRLALHKPGEALHSLPTGDGTPLPLGQLPKEVIPHNQYPWPWPVSSACPQTHLGHGVVSTMTGIMTVKSTFTRLQAPGRRLCICLSDPKTSADTGSVLTELASSSLAVMDNHRVLPQGEA